MQNHGIYLNFNFKQMMNFYKNTIKYLDMVYLDK